MLGSHRLHRRLLYDARLQSHIAKALPVRAECGLTVSMDQLCYALNGTSLYRLIYDIQHMYIIEIGASVLRGMSDPVCQMSARNVNVENRTKIAHI